MLDWRGSYPRQGLPRLLSCSSPQGDICLEGKHISGSFWSSEPSRIVNRTDRLRGAERDRELQRLEAMTAAGIHSCVAGSTQAWSQPSLEQPLRWQWT